MEPNPPTPAAIEELASRASSDIVSALAIAYAKGRADMRRELMVLLSPASAEATLSGTAPNVVISRSSTKAPPGTVKPTILRMLEETPLPTEQIISLTGFKENSVRGTLSTLFKAGIIERNGGFWKKTIKASTSEPMEAK